MFVLVPPSPVHFVPYLREVAESFADEAPSWGEVNAVYESGDAPPSGAPCGEELRLVEGQDALWGAAVLNGEVDP